MLIYKFCWIFLQKLFHIGFIIFIANNAILIFDIINPFFKKFEGSVILSSLFTCNKIMKVMGKEGRTKI